MSYTTVKAKVCDLFNLPQIPAENTILVRQYASPHPMVPEIEHHVFNVDELRDLVNWWRGTISRNIWLYGPTGTGKTSTIEQFAARLGIPVYKIGCHLRREFSEFEGRWTFKRNESGTGTEPVFNKGVLPMSMEEGAILLLDEYDTCNPSTAMAFNAVLDSQKLLITETSELVKANDKWLVAACCNSNGSGDQTGQYRGVQPQNAAQMDRWLILKKDYLPVEEEKAILENVASQLPQDIKDAMIAYGNELRAVNVWSGGGLNVPFTTRTLIAWAKWTLSLYRSKISGNTLEVALEKVLLQRGEPTDQEVMRQIWQRVNPIGKKP